MDTAHAPLAGTERKLDRLLAHYGESHRNPANELIHFVAIPAILLSIVGLLYALHPWVAYLFVAASLVYYALLRSAVLFVTMAVSTGVVLALVRALGDRVVPVSATVSSWRGSSSSSGTRLKAGSHRSSRTSSTSGSARCSW